MDILELKYGCNPNQKPASVYCEKLPITVLNGKPGYINLLDALNAWQLVSELFEATGTASAASFKHVSPAGAAIGLPLSLFERAVYGAERELSPLACAYLRARGADRMSSFGDFIALSDICGEDTASVIRHEVSDGVIAPGYSEGALEILRQKRGGSYCVLKIDKDYVPASEETRQVYGTTFSQARNDAKIDAGLLSNIVTERKILSPEAERDLLIALITLKYTQSNSVCLTKGGQVIGVGAGQQSRIHCTRLAANKADLWHLRRHERILKLPFKEDISRPEKDNAIDCFLQEEECPQLLANWESAFTKKPAPLSAGEKRSFLSDIDSVCMGSDAFFPFEDNILRAKRSGVKYIAQPGGSIRDRSVIDCCDKNGMTMAFTGLRLFHH